MTALWLALASLLGLAGSAQTEPLQVPAQTLALTRANLIDGVSPEPARNVTVLIRAGRIERVTRGRSAIPPGASVIDLGGRWILPGLIDAHVHLRDLRSARAALQAGVTTARSMGVPHFAHAGIRDLHAAGAADIPDVLAAGYHVQPQLDDEFFLDFPQLRRLSQGLTSPDSVRLAVRAMRERGADFIKVMATERAGLPELDMLSRGLTDEQLRAAVAEASAAGLAVAAHAHTDEAARAAVRMGVRTIEHGTLTSEATLTLMREREACLVPTLTFWIDMLEPGGQYDHPVLMERARAMYPQARSTTARAARLGVRVVAGSDMRYTPGISTLNIADEIVAISGSGLSPMTAIQAATSTAAACLGIATRTGAVREGMEADLIVVESNPLQDLATLRNVRLVVNDGVIAVDRLPVAD